MRRAGPADVDAIAAMREAVGWNVSRWALDMVLVDDPDTLCLAVEDEERRMVAIGSSIAYGALGFVGNMIVVDDFRRRGVGSAVLDAVVEFLVGRGCTRLELFATSEGRPLYARHGFELTGTSHMGRLRREAPLEPGATVQVATTSDAAALAAYDAPRFGGNRQRLLAAMAADPQRPVLAARVDGRIVGFGWVRTEAGRVGPLVADGPDIAAALVRAAFDLAPAMEEIGLNIPSGNEAGGRWLEELGVELEPWDGRMARGPQIPRRDETVYANLVGALG